MTTTIKTLTDSMRGMCIITKFLGPTDHRGSRIVARTETRRLVVECDDRIGHVENHAAAAIALATELGWLEHSDLVGGGGLPDSTGYAFIMGPKARTHATWTVEPGRALVRDGQEIASVSRFEGPGMLMPYYVDCLTKRIAALLTEHGDGLAEAKRALSDDDDSHEGHAGSCGLAACTTQHERDNARG